MSDAFSDSVVRRLDADTVLRHAGAADLDALMALNVEVFGTQEGPATSAMLRGGLGIDWLVVGAGPDAARPGGPIAAACARIPHTFDLDGVQFAGSQLENVASDPRFRRRGLIRALFDAAHEQAAAAGELLQVIGGIPYFYRRLGYGYAFDVPPTVIVGPDATPPLDSSGVTVRDARPDDVGWIRSREDSRPREGLTVVRTEDAVATWLMRAAPADGPVWESVLVAEVGGAPVGWLRVIAWADGSQVYLLPGAAPDRPVAGQLLAQSVTVARRLADRLGRPFEVLAADPPGTPWSRVVHGAGRRWPEPSGYYARVPDEVALLRAIAPVLSARLSGSGLAHDSGTLSISLYERGVQLEWRDGHVVRVDATDPEPDPFDKGGVGVAPDWFPALVLGRWGASGLAARTDDTILGDHATVMDVLFPARPNDVVTDL